MAKRSQGGRFLTLFCDYLVLVGPSSLVNDSVALFYAVLIEQNRADDDKAGKERLPVALEPHRHKPLLEYAHDENADDGSNQCARTAAHRRAADDDARNAEKFLSVSCAWNN